LLSLTEIDCHANLLRAEYKTAPMDSAIEIKSCGGKSFDNLVVGSAFAAAAWAGFDEAALSVRDEGRLPSANGRPPRD
jgi:hypothetical protein